jgi:hypothetical protein
MSAKFECLITEATRNHAGLTFAFGLVHEADEQRMLEQIGNELSKRKIRCTIDIGEAKPNAAMIIDRWSEGPLTYCVPEDVEKLEAQNAELLKALEEIMKQTDQRSNYLIDHVYLIARFAIAKAKGQPLC